MEEHICEIRLDLWGLLNFARSVGAIGSDVIYRGQSNSKWKLIPGLYRYQLRLTGNSPEDKRWLQSEDNLLAHFFNRAGMLLPNFKRHPILDRVIAQHYGVPTQLLDWTLDPLIALYFAVQNMEVDGALYYIYPLTGAGEKAKIELPYRGPILRLVPPHIDERLKMQKSIFTLQAQNAEEGFMPLDDRKLKFSNPSEGSHPDDQVMAFGRIIIPSIMKGNLRLQLWQLGVDSSLLFPGLQGIGQRIADYTDMQQLGGFGMLI